MKNLVKIFFVLAIVLLAGPATAFTAAEIPSHPEIFNLVERVALRSKVLFNANQSDGYGIGFAYDCIYFQAFCAEVSPRGNIFDLRLTIDSHITGRYVFLCVMSGDTNVIKCKSLSPIILMSFQKSGNSWVATTYDTLSLLGKGYGSTFHLNKSCNAKACETPPH